MSFGETGMPTGTISNVDKRSAQARANELGFTSECLIMTLVDGRSISLPLRLYPTLQKATTAQREASESIGSGRAFHWEELDLDLSVEGLLGAHPQRVPAPPPIDNR